MVGRLPIELPLFTTLLIGVCPDPPFPSNVTVTCLGTQLLVAGSRTCVSVHVGFVGVGFGFGSGVGFEVGGVVDDPGLLVVPGVGL